MKNIGKPFPPAWFVIISIIFAIIYTSIKNQTISASAVKQIQGKNYNKPPVVNATKSVREIADLPK